MGPSRMSGVVPGVSVKPDPFMSGDYALGRSWQPSLPCTAPVSLPDPSRPTHAKYPPRPRPGPS